MLNNEEKYAEWLLDKNATTEEKAVFYCSACGENMPEKYQDDFREKCPHCNAKIVTSSGKTDINGHEICSRDKVRCFIPGHQGPVEGTIVYEGIWYLKNPVKPVYYCDCENILVTEGVVPEGKYICRDNVRGNARGKK